MSDALGWLRLLRREPREAEDRDCTDAHPVSEHARRRENDPELQRRLKLRRRTLVLGLSAV